LQNCGNFSNHWKSTKIYIMKVEQTGNTVTIIDTQADLDSFRLMLANDYKTFQKSNIIVDISKHKSLSVKEIESFLPLSKTHKKAKKSFIVVTSEPDFNAVSDKLAVVRSLQEAHDIIEMEEIERDLGF
jgi:hypothetical protein